MISFKDYLKETLTLDILTQQLSQLGYSSIKLISKYKIAVLTQENRISVLEKIAKSLDGATYIETPSSASSVGYVKVDRFSILAKPLNKQGNSSAGIDNETILVDTINKYTLGGAVNIIFSAHNKNFTINGCVKAESVGRASSNRRKADVVLTDIKGVHHNISIKKDDAEIWESADTFFSVQAKDIIEKSIKSGLTSLADKGSYYNIQPNIAVKASPKEIMEVVFGSDIFPHGAIITKTFKHSHFIPKTESLVIDCSHIITELSDVEEKKDVYFLMRNDKTRKSIKDFPGIRVLAVYKSRINKNVRIVSR